MIRAGDRACLTRAFGPDDLATFAVLSGASPGGTVPEPLIGALFSCLLGTRLPGPGTGWLKQTLHHHAPARLLEHLTASVEVTRLRPDKRLADLDCTCLGADDRLICTGRALMLVSPECGDLLQRVS